MMCVWEWVICVCGYDIKFNFAFNWLELVFHSIEVGNGPFRFGRWSASFFLW